MALAELGRFEVQHGRVKVTSDGCVLLRRFDGATLYPLATQAPQQLPLHADERGMERGEVCWSVDGTYMASTSLEGKLQLLSREEDTYVALDVLDHGFAGTPQLCWSVTAPYTTLALWRGAEHSWRLWRGAGLESIAEPLPLRGIAWCPDSPLLALWYSRSNRSAASQTQCTQCSSVRLWSQDCNAVVSFQGPVCDVSWTRGLHAATVLLDGQVILWSVSITDEMQLETSVLQNIPPPAPPLLDTWEIQWSPQGTALALLPWRQLRLHGSALAPNYAQHRELHFAVTAKHAEKVVPGSTLEVWPAPRVWQKQWCELRLEGFALTVHGWSPAGRFLLVVAQSLTPAVGHLKRCRVQLWGMEEAGPAVPMLEISELEDCPLHQLHVVGSGSLLVAAVDGSVRMISLEADRTSIILGDAWNCAAPTGAAWRNWPRGAIDARILPCHRIAVTLRHRPMAGDSQDGDTVVVFGRHFEGSNYRRLMLSRNLDADLPRDDDAALKSLQLFLSQHASAAPQPNVLDLVRQRAERYLHHVRMMLGDHPSSPSSHWKSQVQAAAAWSTRGSEADIPDLCELINHAVELDDAEALKSLLHFLLSLQAWHHSLRSPLLPPTPQKDAENVVRLCCVGEALQETWRPFFRKGNTYRLPGFATLRDAAKMEASALKSPRSEWYLDLPGPQGALYIDAELAEVAGGLWILPPYTVLEVLSAEVADAGDVDIITLRLPGDSLGRLDLPIGPPM